MREARRYSAYRYDVGEDFNPSRLAEVVQEKMAKTLADEFGFVLKGFYKDIIDKVGLRRFYRDASEEEREACCQAFADYLSIRVRR